MNAALGLRSAPLRHIVPMTQIARFRLGQTVRHRDHAFAGVIVDVDAAYAGTPGDVDAAHAGQPYYRVLAVGEEGGFVAYAAEDVLTVGGVEAVDLPVGWLRKDRSGRVTPAAHTLQ